MKLSFNFKEKKATLDADVETVVDRHLERNSKKPPRKTRYQIKQEETRKNKEQAHRYNMKLLLYSGGFLVFIIIFATVMSFLER